MVEATLHGERKVYSVSAFNQGIAEWLRRLPDVWVEGEVTELRRNDAWATVFFTLKDPGDRRVPAGDDAAPALRRARARARRRRARARRRARRDVRGEGRAQLPGRHDRAARARRPSRRRSSGSSASSRPRGCSPPSASARCRASRAPSASLTGADAAARGDVSSWASARGSRRRTSSSPRRACRAPARPPASLRRSRRVAAHPAVDVVVVARGGGSFEDLLPFSDERVVRAVAACPVPVVSAVGHEQDTPLCDLAADVRASTPTAAARLVVPDLAELSAALERLARGGSSARCAALLARDRERLERDGPRASRGAATPARAPARRCSTTPARGCRRSRRARRWRAATPSCARAARALQDAAAVAPGQPPRDRAGGGRARRDRGRGACGAT